MRRLLFLIPDLDYGGQARQVSLLARHLPRETFAVCVCVLGSSSPWAEMLHKAGVEVEVLGWRRPFDLAPFLALRRLVRRWRPEVIHVWGQLALRALTISGSGSARVVLSGALGPGRAPGWLDRWLWGRVERVAALGEAEAVRYRQLGVPPQRLTVIWPAVPAYEPTPVRLGSPDLPKLPPRARVLLTLGPFAPHKGHRDAVWALDILHYLYSDLHLVLAGGGPDRTRVMHFTHFLGVEQHTHFPGPCADLRPLLERAEVVWVPSHAGGGVCAALEAMAAGKPVVAARLPRLAEVVVEGVTGSLFDPGDKADLARETRLLLDDSARRRQFGAAGQVRVAQHFTVNQLVQRCARLYE